MDEYGFWFEDRNDFDLLIENALSFRQIMGYEICSAGGGRLFGGDTTALAANRSQKARFNPGLGFLAFGPLVVAEVRTE